MTDIRKLADLRELDPVELAGVEGGYGLPNPQLTDDTNRLVYPPELMKHLVVPPKPQYAM
jgi:hypothetical protein